MTTPAAKPADDVEAAAAAVNPTGDAGILRNNGETSWDGPDDPENPYNWPSPRKVTIGLVCSTSQLVTTMSASMLVPALDNILEDLGMSPSSGQIAFSIFFLGLGFAPFLVAPLAEMYGRKPVWVAGNVFYIFWNALCPVGFSPALMILGRLLCACGASVGVTLTLPVLADMYGAKDRGTAASISGLLPYLGPALGPIIGGIAAQHVWWPWLFWILSIFDVLAVVLGLIVIRETYAPVLLRRKARRLATAASGTSPPKMSTGDIVRRSYCDFTSRVGPAIGKPVRLLLFRPIIQIIAVTLAVIFGIYCLVLGTFSSLWRIQYHQSQTASSLHYIAISLGAIFCAQAGAPLMDMMWRHRRSACPDSTPTPEYRLPYMAIGLIPGVAGLFWYAWAAERAAHWAVVDVGIGLFTAGNFMFSQGMLAYMLDEFPRMHSASAGAGSRLGTYVFGFAFPIFAPNLYASLGYGWGNSLLAFLFLGVGASALVVLWIWGEQLRALGRGKDAEAMVE